MANRNRGEVVFIVGERSLTLHFGANAIAEAETLLDKGIGELLLGLGDKSAVRIGTLRALLWAALRRHHKDIDLLKAGDLIDEAGAVAAGVAISEAITAALPALPAPEDGAEREPNPPGPGASTGDGSTAISSRQASTGRRSGR